MLGMIKKDLLMIKNNSKFIWVAIMIYIMYTIMFEMDMTFFLPFMALVLVISTFSYDDFNNWHAYAVTLPAGRTNVVKSKYITGISLTVLMTVLSILANFIIGKTTMNMELEESIYYALGIITGISLTMSVLFPIVFKYGSEKGRIIMMVLCFSVVGIGTLLFKLGPIPISKSTTKFLDDYILWIMIITSILMIGISYRISKKIYVKKEF